MKNTETLRFINNNIKGCKGKVVLLSICQTLLGVLVVAFSFMLRFVITAIEERNNDALTKYTIIIGAITVALVALQIFYHLYYEVSYIDIENRLKNNLYKTILNNDYQEIKKTHDEEWIHR